MHAYPSFGMTTTQAKGTFLHDAAQVFTRISAWFVMINNVLYMQVLHNSYSY